MDWLGHDKYETHVQKPVNRRWSWNEAINMSRLDSSLSKWSYLIKNRIEELRRQGLQGREWLLSRKLAEEIIHPWRSHLHLEFRLFAFQLRRLGEVIY